MNLVRASLRHPVVVLALVLAAMLFGGVSLTTIPVQLTPDVERPVITVRTNWPGAAPADVEREIITQQENALKGVDGLQDMTSAARRGGASITLEFGLETNMADAMLDVSNRLNQISSYPDEAKEPRLDTAGSEDTPIASLVLERLPGNERPMTSYGDLADNRIANTLERVPGVALVRVYGTGERQLQIEIDPVRLAMYRLSVSDVISALRNANISTSAGFVNEGKRRYLVRIDGDLNTVDRVTSVLLRSERNAFGLQSARITVGDIANVKFGYEDSRMVLRSLGQPAMSMSVLAESRTNVMDTMERVRQEIDKLNATILKKEGVHLGIIYDQTDYVRNAIDLVLQNVYVGGALAALILLAFLRSGRATLIVSLSIPISIIGTFLGMSLLGRSLNVISLAGLAFAVGMVVDAAIVVLENIFRHRELGMSRARAAEVGARQVWEAVLVSSLTTVVVFIPLLLMKDEVGQLFRDIAVAVVVSVCLSMLVAITVIPVLARRILGKRRESSSLPPLPVLGPMAGAIQNGLMHLIAIITAKRRTAILTVGIVACSSIALTATLTPKLEYLPEGNRNMAFGAVRPPPGYNLDMVMQIADRIENAVRPLWAKNTGPDSLPGQPPKIEHFSFRAFGSGYIEVIATSVDPSRVAELIPVMRKPIFDEPGTYGFMSQPSLFSRHGGGARAILVNISGDDLATLADVARTLAAKIGDVFPRRDGYQLQPRPGLELGTPEIRLHPDPVRLRDAGVSARDFAYSIDVFNDGMQVSELTIGNDRVDLTLKAPDALASATQDIGNLPVVTADGTIVPARSLANIEITEGPAQIQHVDGLRTFSLQIRPPANVPLQETIERLEQEVIAPVLEAGIPKNVNVGISGVAGKLDTIWTELLWQLALAACIVFLLMAALFGSLRYPLMIMVTLPIAFAGGMASLGILNLFIHTPLDLLTALGFVILIGIVVNNAILLVHQSLYNHRQEGLSMVVAVREATRARLRPIFMSTLTSLFGMAPLVLFPGAGSELYRGLGAVVLGGLLLSMIMTLLVVPALMCLIPDGKAKRNLI